LAELSLPRAWNEAAAFVKREGSLLFPVALLAVLPGAALRLLMPAPPRGELPPPGPWMLLIPVAIIIAIIANIAINRLVLRPGTSVGEALGHGLRRMPALLAVAAMLGLASVLLLTVIATIIFAATAPPGAQPSPAAMSLAIIVMLPLALYLGARLLLTTPVAAAEPGGPLAILRRSWTLTRDHVWTLIGLLVLIAILVLVVLLAVSAVAGILIILVAGPPDPGSIARLLLLAVATLLNMVMTVYLATLIARIYAQLAGDAASGT
jgi:hypothetical protein